MAMKSKLMMMSKIKAKKKPEHKAAVEGDAPRQRLDRASRMRRADGGVTISEDSKKEAGRLRESANEKMAPGGLGVMSSAGALGALIGLAATRGRKMPPMSRGEKITAGAATGVGALGAKGVYDVKDKVPEAKAQYDEAKRIERGEAEPGKEDRKKGGRVCK